MPDGMHEEAFLRAPEVEARTGLGRSTLDRLMAEGQFPRPRRIGKVAVAWLQSELVEWMRTRPEADPLDVRGPNRKRGQIRGQNEAGRAVK